MILLLLNHCITSRYPVTFLNAFRMVGCGKCTVSNDSNWIPKWQQGIDFFFRFFIKVAPHPVQGEESQFSGFVEKPAQFFVRPPE